MKEYDLTIRGNDYHVELKNLEDNLAQIEVNGTPYKVYIKQEVKKAKTPVLVRKPLVHTTEPSDVKSASKAGGSVGTVNAPLPGTIFALKVKEGDFVNNGDVLLIMEAMKMENEIESEISGKVLSIKVKENDSVLEGDVLVEIGG